MTEETGLPPRPTLRYASERSGRQRQAIHRRVTGAECCRQPVQEHGARSRAQATGDAPRRGSCRRVAIPIERVPAVPPDLGRLPAMGFTPYRGGPHGQTPAPHHPPRHHADPAPRCRRHRHRGHRGLRLRAPRPRPAAHPALRDLHRGPPRPGRVAHAVPRDLRGHGIHRGVLDPPLPDPGDAWLRGLSGERPPRQERPGPEERRAQGAPGLPVAPGPSTRSASCGPPSARRRRSVPCAHSSATATASSSWRPPTPSTCRRPSPRGPFRSTTC